MNHDLTIAQYLKNRAPVAPMKRPAAPAPFVTISRETGAGARALADALIARLSKERGTLFSGWHIFDRALCERVAADPELRVSLKSLLDEEFHAGFDEFFRGVFAEKSSQLKIDHHVFRTVRGICSLGKAIVIGRAAALVTRDLPRGVHVRLVAERNVRIQRIVREAGVSAAAARKTMEKKDAERARMVMADFDKNIDDPLLYDCVWNTATVTLEEIVESLTALIRKRSV
jgi:cytidylate kinase